jgi:hypothetical protein
MKRFREVNPGVNKIADARASQLIDQFAQKFDYDPVPQKRENVPRGTPQKSSKKSQRKVTPKSSRSFEKFYRKQLEKNPSLSGREAVRQFRAKGGKVGDKQAREVRRSVLGVEKNPKKVTNVKMRPRPQHVNFKKFIGSPYVALVTYMVEDEQSGFQKQEFMYVGIQAPPPELRPVTAEYWESEARNEVWLYWQEQYLKNDEEAEKYKAVDLVYESIHIFKDSSGHYALFENDGEIKKR